MMTENQPPGFTWQALSLLSRRPSLLLPRSVTEELAQQALEDEEDEPALPREIERLIKSLLTRERLSVQQVQDSLLALTQRPGLEAEAPAVTPRSNLKTIPVFDMAAINKLKADKNLTRGMKSVLGRFKEGETGQRVLKPVPAQFRKKIQRLKIHYPNCVEFLDYVASFAQLAAKQPYPAFYFPPVLLVGPPGIGKTAVVNALAEVVGILTRQVDFASNTAGMVLGGLSTQWSDAKTGVVVDLLREGDAANCILILDELDKASSEAKHDPLGPLYTLLEQGPARRFVDEALDLPSDASHVLYVATANRLEAIPKPILSRFIVVPIHPIEAKQHRAVTQSIYRSLLALHGCASVFEAKLTNVIIEKLLGRSPRVIKATLRRALAQAAARDPKAKKLRLQPQDLMLASGVKPALGEYEGRRGFGFN